MNTQITKNKIVLYEDKSGNVELCADIEKDTMWATQEQIVQLFDVDQSVVSRHVKNILKDGEIDEKSNMQKMHIANSDRPITLYSLDIILAVGYRTNSKKAIAFRKWASKILRDYLIKGYTLNRRTIALSPEKLDGLHETIALLESQAHSGRLKGKITLKVTKELVSN